MWQVGGSTVQEMGRGVMGCKLGPSKPQKLILPEFWRPEVLVQGVHRAMPSQSKEESFLPLPVLAASGLPRRPQLPAASLWFLPLLWQVVSPLCVLVGFVWQKACTSWLTCASGAVFWFVFAVFIGGLHYLPHERPELVIPGRLLLGPGREPWRLALTHAPRELSGRGSLLWAVGKEGPSAVLIVPQRRGW